MPHDTPSIVLVEDDLRLSELVSHYLAGAGFRVTVLNHGTAAAERILHDDPDLVILDLGLPGQDGLSICRALRPLYRKPILILTARASDIDHVLGLELGADDYVIKPVQPRVLQARVLALLRRNQSHNAAVAEVLQFGGLLIDSAARKVTLNEETVALSNAEFELLSFLARHAGEVQSREALFQHLYRREYDGLDRMLDVRISHLRRKLGDDTAAERIKTVWGQGYLFVANAW
jgi:DNA-binding response OmpR family regulator